MRRSIISLTIFSNLLLLLRPCGVAAVPQMGGFYPNGFFEGDSLLQRSSGAGASYHTVQLVQPAATFYGDQYNILTVSSNGLILLGNQASFSPEQEPQLFPTPAPAVIAPFWARADYQASSAGGEVLYRVSQSSVLLERARQDVNQAYGSVSADFSELVIVTWKDLRSFSEDMGNTFQCVIAISSSATFVLFLYDDTLMNWSGSPPAMVGFNSGDGVHSQALPASLTPSVLEITETGNAGTSGKWVFRVDGANVEMMGVVIGLTQTDFAVPEGNSFVLCATTFIGAISERETVDITPVDITTDGAKDFGVRQISSMNFDFDPSGNRTRCQQVYTTPDSIYEADERFELRLSIASTNQIILLPRTARATIKDDDTVFVNYGDSSVVEEDGMTLICAQLVDPLRQQNRCVIEKPVTLQYYTYPGDATDGEDYIGANDTVSIIPPSCNRCVKIAITDDNIFEEKETFFYAFTSDNDKIIVNRTHTFANVTITDRDAPSVKIGLTETYFSTQEGGGVTVCTQMNEGVISQPLTVTIQTGHIDRLVGNNINVSVDGRDLIGLHEDLTFDPSRPDEVKCVNVTTLTDTIYEGTEYRGIVLSSDIDVTFDPKVATLQIMDENEVSVTVERTQYNYKEGQDDENHLPICANLTGEIERNLHIKVKFHAGTATKFDFSSSRDGDVEEHIADIVFEVPQGRPSKVCDQGCMACTYVTIIDDQILEHKFENFSLSLSHKDSAVHFASSRSVVTVEDNDAVEIFLLDAETSGIVLGEDAEAIPEICMERRGLSVIDISVMAVPHGLTATEGEDFVANGNRVFFSGSSNGQTEVKCGHVSVSVLEDRVVEGNETLELIAMSEEPERIVVRNAHPMMVTILDNDDVSVGFVSSAFNVTEGEGQLEACVEMTGFSAIPLSLTVSTWPDTAIVGTDFTLQSLPLHLPLTDQDLLRDMFSLPVSQRLVQPLPTSPPICVSISIIDDQVLELLELKSFNLNLSSSDMFVSLVQPSTASVTIRDDDNVTIIVNEASKNLSVTEGESVHICAEMLGMADFPIPASFLPHAFNNSAEADVDFRTTEQALNFPALSAELQCVNVLTIEDNVVERGEEFWVELTLPEVENSKIALGSSEVLVSIVDDDFVTVSMVEPEYSVIESEGEVEVCVELVGRTDVPVTVFFAVPGPPEDRQGDPDYVPIPNILLFESLSDQSVHRECINISVSNDSVLEDTEHFDVVLSSPDSAVHVMQGTSRVYIIDDDGVRVGLRERSLVVPEGEGEAVPICVEVVGRFQESIEVELESRSTSAQAGADYTPLSHTLTFNPSLNKTQEMCVNISVRDDFIFEDSEIFNVSLRAEHDGISIHIRETAVTILDNDQVLISLDSNGLDSNETSLSESTGALDLCVQLTGLIEKNIPYQIEVTPIEATLGSDFHFTAAPLTQFTPTPAPQQAQCQQIRIVDDAILENTEHFEVRLIPPVGVARVLVGVVRTQVAITDNDEVRIGFAESAFEVDEDGDEEERRLEVCVELEGEIERAVGVGVSSVSGTADAQDFDAVNKDFTFSPGATFAPRQCFNVSIRPDRLVERSEFFSLVMSSDSLGVMLEPATALVTITDQDVVCVPMSLDTSRGYFSWPETFPSETAVVKCENGTGTRFCAVTGDWEKPVVTGCYVSTNELFRYIEKHGFSEDNLKELLFAALQLVREDETPSVKYAEIVDQIFREFLEALDRQDIEPRQELFEVVLEILNAVQMWPQSVLKEISSSTVGSFERITENIFKIDEFSSLRKFQRQLSFYSEKSPVAELFPQDEPALRYLFVKDADGNIEIQSGDRRVTRYEASITFPRSLSAHLTMDETGLLLAYYESGNLFPLVGNDTAYTRVTSVVAASFAGQDIEDLKEDVLVSMRLEASGTANITCVSWDFEANDGFGSWVEDGCELVSLQDGEAVCACSHLTNFACLVEDEPPSVATDPLIPYQVPNTLSVLVIIGVCISTLALILTIVTLLLFGKLRKRDNTKFRLQLCIAMILMLIFFVIGIYQVETFEICLIASALLHYFTLVTAMWMASDALLMLLKLTMVFSHPSTCYVVIVSLLSWLLPIPVVVVPAAINTDFVITNEYCFISHSTVFFAALLGPIGVLMLFTLLIFLVALCYVAAYSSSKYRGSKKAKRRKGACSTMFSILGIMVLFGLTWAFGAFTVRQGPDYFRYLFVGFNSLQGFFVFLFFVVFAKETTDLWMQSCGCKRQKKRKTILSAITGVVPPRPKRMMLDKRADRLKEMEEVDLSSRLGTNSWDISFVMPQGQFGMVLGSTLPAADMEQGTWGATELAPAPASRTGTRMEQSPRTLSRTRIECSPEPASRTRVEQSPASPNTQMEQSPEASPRTRIKQSPEGASPGSPRRDQRSSSLISGASLVEQGGRILACDEGSPSKRLIGYSPTRSLDSAQNALECMSTADSGILMDKVKNTPSPPPNGAFQHPQSGSTPHHVHSVSGIGYVSAESSMETLPQREEECYNVNKEPITLAPSLKPRVRAVSNQFATVDMDNL